MYRDIWKRAPLEGEVEYNWQKQRDSAKPDRTFGRTPDETMRVLAYRRYMIGKIRRYHTSYLGWIDNYNAADPEVLAGAAELQKAFCYRFVLDSARYPLAVQPGGKLGVKLTMRNTRSAPFYLDWPVAVGLLDPATKRPVWSGPLSGVDIRTWLPVPRRAVSSGRLHHAPRGSQARQAPPRPRDPRPPGRHGAQCAFRHGGLFSRRLTSAGLHRHRLGSGGTRIEGRPVR